MSGDRLAFPAATRFTYGDREFRFFHADEQDHIFQIISSSGCFYEMGFLDALGPLIAPGDLVLDIGANIGNHSLYFAGVRGARVVAMEPNPAAVRILEQNIAANGLEDLIEIRAQALGKVQGQAELRGTGAGNLGAESIAYSENGDIPVLRLDGMELPTIPRLLKIDAEGMDLEVVEGARGLLAEAQPIIAFEAADRKDFDAIAAILHDLDYIYRGSYNYTPTHVFLVPPSNSLGQIVRQIASNEGRHYIDFSLSRMGEDRHFRNVTTKLASLGEVSTFVQQFLSQQPTQIELSESIAQLCQGIMGIVSGTHAELGNAQGVVTQLGTSLDKLGGAQQAAISQLESRLDALGSSQQADIAQLETSLDKLGGAQQAVISQLESRLDALGSSQQAVISQFEVLLGELSGTQQHAFVQLATQLREFGISCQTQLHELTCAQQETHVQFTTSMSDLDDTLQSMVASLEARVCSLGGDVAGVSEQLGGISRLVASLEKEVASSLAALEKDVLVGLQAQLSSGVRFDTRLKAMHQAMSSDVEQQISRLRDEVRDALQQSLQEHMTSLGTFFGDLVVEMDRRAVRRAPHTAPPHRDFFVSHEHDPREILPWAPLASIPAQPEGVSANLGSAVKELASYDLKDGWEGKAWATGVALLDEDGLVRLDPGGRAGIVTAMFDAAGGGVFGVRADVAELPEGKPLIMRVRSEADEQWGPDLQLVRGANELRVFAPGRTERLKIELVATDLKESSCFRMRSVDIVRIDPEENQRRVRRSIGEPVIASMASIPSRIGMLEDCVRSLLVQCDKVRVFLNNYQQIPDFLDHPRVEVRRSQDWDDRGDAGKFHWIDQDGDEGYRIIADDDLIFPPDFAKVMADAVAAHDGKAIYCTHGVLLRQPIRQYYDADSRAATFHFARTLEKERTVHIGATNAMCFHSSAVAMRWADFRYCNSGDIWISGYAQKNGLSMIAIPRPLGWVRENRHEAPEDTIYNHSRRRTRSRFDSSLVQDAVLRYAWPLTLQPVSRPKLGIVFVAQNAERLSAAINSWLSARSLDVDWVVMIVGTNARHSARDMASSLTIEHEVHLVEQGKTLGDRLACAKDLAIRIEVKAMLTVTDAVRFGQFGWESHVFSQPQNAGSVWALTAEGRGETLLEVSYGDADGTVSARVEIFGLIEGLPVPGLERVLTVDPKISPTRRALSPTPVAEQAGVQVISEGQGHAVRPGRTVNEIFERVQVLNLDRRPDRWEEMKWQLDNAGIAAERFGAVDGSLPEIGAEFEEYASQPLVPFPVHVEHLDFGIDFYIHPPCQVARVAQLEQRSVSKAIASAGAWGYMRSYRTILEQSLADQVETLLVFDDDVLFHRDFEALFAQVAEELPEDWLVLQLGTLQYNWEQPWFDPVSNHLYRTNGAAIGSHAVGMRFEAIPSILDHVSRMDMPFDIGAMSAFTQAFPEQCFIALPNLAIQRLGRKSDINTSEFQKASTIEETAATYRWNLADYPDGECASADLGMGHDRKAGT